MNLIIYSKEDRERLEMTSREENPQSSQKIGVYTLLYVYGMRFPSGMNEIYMTIYIEYLNNITKL